MSRRTIQIAPAFEDFLRAAGVASFDAIMVLESRHIARDFPGRTTVRIELGDRTGPGRGFFLKRYSRRYLSPAGYLLRWLHWPGFTDEAEREWVAMHALRALGITTPDPVAVGHETVAGTVVRSFVMTAEIAGGQPADAHLRRCDNGARRDLARRLGRLTARLHGAGYVHKDYYLSHFFVVPGNPEPAVVLLDLQRVCRPRLWLGRWLVKDLAALAFSALRAGLERRHLFYFLREYRGIPRLGGAGKRLCRRILRRVARFQRHQPKHDRPVTPSGKV